MSGDSSTDIKDSELNKEMAAIAADRWDHYNEVIIPAQNRWIQSQAEQNAEKYYQRAAGDANVASQRATGLQQAQMLEQGGNTARLASATESGARQQQSTTSEASNAMQLNQQKRYLGGLGNVLAVGQGQEAKAITTGSTAADYANRYAMQEAANQDDNLSEVIGMGIGAGTRYGMGS
ncbi:TPA: hypothetical protein ACX3EJ_001035 [Vibrio parahaemolyticus]|uniref:hypothetical protein n=1 Tax=Vibrio parahaemolyticus TaxID=670 RepID=UPI000A376475|nr:hypothetical protein [Vibrio parahaemolyticus]EGQ8030253.1 hypothetical protein [Vibrio parahaemolyticus]EHV9720245.1 hypothetical protein [Vibrio parahaemolyticus]OUJ46331.1 hypothetical protein BTZ53_10975 [Vibrio parahaemolyticus]HCG6030280.1 hypothetical protein [Vibrio parahaemolyticus]HDF8527417.1 hypothetical protein [Vibrio parahaemolyticus]